MDVDYEQVQLQRIYGGVLRFQARHIAAGLIAG
jgi:hypothetical protein